MTTAVSFPAQTTHFSLPLLFAGQAQKEFFINQSLSVIDGLLQMAVESSIAAPPAEPEDGMAFRIQTAATGDWAGKDGELAVRVAGSWQYITPTDGLRIFERSSKQFIHYDAGWQETAEPALPNGGTVIDLEARATINFLIEALRNAGIFGA